MAAARRVTSVGSMDNDLPGRKLDFEYTVSANHAVVDARQLVFKTSSLALLKAKGVNVPGAYLPDGEVSTQGGYLKGAKLVLDYMNELYRSQKMCDVLIPVRQGELRAHKIALGAYSDTLTRKFCEFPQGEVMCIDLTDFDIGTVQVVLNFLYTTEIQVTQQSVGPIMHCAVELGIDILIHICKNFLSNVTEDTVLLFYDIATRYGLDDVRVSTYQFICEHFSEISRSTTFLMMTVDRLISLLCDDNLAIGELEIFEAIVRWVNYNKAERLPYAPSLLRCVRFQRISPENLVTRVESVSFIFEPRECHDILYEAVKYHALKMAGSVLASSYPQQNPRHTDPNHSSHPATSGPHHARGPVSEPMRETPINRAVRSHHQVQSMGPVSMVSPTASRTVATKQGYYRNPTTPSHPRVITIADPHHGHGRNPRVAVIGAGAVGLAAAVRLQEEIPNAEITIIADAFNESTLSDGAAGIFRPSWEKAEGMDEKTIRQWVFDSWAKFDALAHSEMGPESGLSVLSGYQFFDKPCREPLLIDGVVYHLRKCNPEDFHVFPCTESFKYGYCYTTLMVESKWFLPFLMKNFMAKGGMIQNKSLEHLQECAGNFDVVVNCTGLRAKDLVNDKKVYSVRGQMERVRAPWIKHFLFDVENETWVLPCRDTVVIGGTLQRHNDSLEISQADKDHMVNKACKLLPSLKNAEFQWTWVGLRPFRKPIRLEKEILNVGGKQLKVVHNYGHGGHGIALSWGCACHATKLVQHFLEG